MSTTTIEEHIIDRLIDGSTPRAALVAEIGKAESVTREAVYKALRNLLKDEICVKRGTHVSLSNQWVIDMAEKWREAEAAYLGTSEAPHLAEKNSIVYTCKTIDQLDALWNHHIIELASRGKADGVFMSCVPHYWFPIIRGQSERRIVSTIIGRGFRWLQLATSAKSLDVNLKKYFSYDGIEYYATELPERHYLNILGDYLIEVSLDKKAGAAIERWYDCHESYDERGAAELAEVLKIKGVYKLKISRNKAKAEKYRRIFRKYFVLK